MASRVVAVVDATATRPVLLTGSAPPHGRDLDLLARPAEHEAIARALAEMGAVRGRTFWAIFEGDTAYGIDLRSTLEWSARPAEMDRLFRDSQLLPGASQLVRPSPTAALLIAARGLVAIRGVLTEKARRKVAEVLERDPQAWDAAEADARALGMSRALDLLRRAYESPAALPRGARAAALLATAAGPGLLADRLRLVRQAAPDHLMPAVVSFSGLDGAGKSTQVLQLERTLSQLGVSTYVQWAGFRNGEKLRGRFPVLDSRRLRARAPDPPDAFIPAAAQGRPVATLAWTTGLALLNAVGLWRFVLRRRDRRVLICDRFSPDSAVKLEFHYRLRRGVDTTWPSRIFGLLAPRPTVGFHVVVSPAVSYGRVGEWNPADLEDMARLYEVQVPRFGLVRLDGLRPPEELHAEVARALWRHL